jgi:hypothetical protein
MTQTDKAPAGDGLCRDDMSVPELIACARAHAERMHEGSNLRDLLEQMADALRSPGEAVAWRAGDPETDVWIFLAGASEAEAFRAAGQHMVQALGVIGPAPALPEDMVMVPRDWLRELVLLADDLHPGDGDGNVIPLILQGYGFSAGDKG